MVKSEFGRQMSSEKTELCGRMKCFCLVENQSGFNSARNAFRWAGYKCFMLSNDLKNDLFPININIKISSSYDACERV